MRKVKRALKWLKEKNVLYKDISLDDECAIPHVLECHKIENSSGSNIETVFEMSAVFSDCNDPSTINGGYKISEEFKKAMLDKLTTDSVNKENTLLARSSSTVLRDYLDTNLLKGFPLQFPYGVGNLDSEKNCRTGTTYLQYSGGRFTQNGKKGRGGTKREF